MPRIGHFNPVRATILAVACLAFLVPGSLFADTAPALGEVIKPFTVTPAQVTAQETRATIAQRLPRNQASRTL